MYYLISINYCSIVTQKASYISVFYGIGLSLIKSSIKKCEMFINKINENEKNSKTRNIDEETSSLISSLEDNNLNKLIIENNFERKSINSIQKPKKIKKNKNLGNDKKSKKFRLLFKTFLACSIIYLVLSLFFFYKFTINFIICGKYIYNLQYYHNNILELFNAYREYLFDQNSIISGMSSYDFLIDKEKLFYSTISENYNYLIVLGKKIKGLYKNHLKFQSKGFCSWIFSYFTSEEQCLNYIGGEDGIISLGITFFINSFVEEIRNARNYMKLLLDQDIFVGNLSEYIMSYYNDTTYTIDKNNTLMFRMQVFNMEETHYRLNIIFQTMIMQMPILICNDTTVKRQKD